MNDMQTEFGFDGHWHGAVSGKPLFDPKVFVPTPKTPGRRGCKRFKELTKENLKQNITINVDTGCWIWNGAKKGGYGIKRINGKDIQVHRLSYELFHGKIPEGNIILHTCDNRPCCNPDHLRAGTQKENVKDCWSKGRHPMGTFSHEEIREIRKLHKEGYTNRQIARRLKAHLGAIWNIISGKTWKHIT